MIKRRTQLLGASAILIGLSAPLSVQAHERDDTWLYVAGAVATYAHFNDHAYYHRGHHYGKHWRKHHRKHHRKAWRRHQRPHRHYWKHRAHDR